MKKQLNVLEVGASSLLDFDYEKGRNEKLPKIEWRKTYNNNKPKFYSTLNKLDRIVNYPTSLRKLIFDLDTVIFSIGNKGPRKKFHEYYEDEFERTYEANFKLITLILPEIIKEYQHKNKVLNIIFLGSISGKEDATYENHAMYAAMKAALSSLARTLKVEYSSNKSLNFIYLELPYTQSRMTGGAGESPDIIRKTILDIIDGKSALYNKR